VDIGADEHVVQEGPGLGQHDTDGRHQLYALSPEAYRQALVSRGLTGGTDTPVYVNTSVTQIGTFTLPWDQPLAQPLQPMIDHVNLLLSNETGDAIGHGGSAPAHEYIGGVEDCWLFRRAVPDNARMVGKGSLGGTSTSARCTEQRPPNSTDPPQVTVGHTHHIGGAQTAHLAKVRQGPCPVVRTTGAVQASYAYIIRCDPADGSSFLRARLPGGQDFILRQVYGVSCADEGGVSGPGYDVQRGDGRGTLDGRQAYVEWEFRDGGTGGANDTAKLRLRLPLCEPDPDDPRDAQGNPLRDAQGNVITEGPAESPAGPCQTQPARTFELDHTVFDGSGTPGSFPGSNQGLNTAVPSAF
jgi:hypothetical protein